jgi:hypothetical protein
MLTLVPDKKAKMYDSGTPCPLLEMPSVPKLAR